jgi:hypothetical protein
MDLPARLSPRIFARHAARFTSGRESITVNIAEVNAFNIGALIAA